MLNNVRNTKVTLQSKVNVRGLYPTPTVGDHDQAWHAMPVGGILRHSREIGSETTMRRGFRGRG